LSSSSSEQKFLVTKNSNLFHYWTLDEAATGPWSDTGTANNSLAVALDGIDITSVAAKHNNGVQMNMGVGSNGITVGISGSGANAPTSNGCAVSAWVSGGTTTGLIGFGSIILTYNGSAGSANFQVAQSNSTNIIATGSHSGIVHLVGIACDGKVEVYANGALLESLTWDGTFASSTNCLIENNGGSLFIADEVAYWKNIAFGSSSLRQEFVNALWNGGAGRFWNGSTFA
jgi:hypothetical protein